MSDEKRTLIETFLPVEEISEEAKIEKIGAARPPISSMHYWWTRKPLIASRAAVLGALLPENYDIKDFKTLLGLDKKKRSHKHDIALEKIELLKKEYEKMWGNPTPTVLDPFAGGGSIGFEAMRVGVNTVAIDYNPVAHLIERATLEYPNIYGDKIYSDVKNGLNSIIQKTEQELKEYYPKYDGNDVLAYVWAWMVICPKCGFDNPLVGQWWLSNKKNRKVFLEPFDVGGQITFKIKNGDNAPEGNCSDAKGVCISCGSVISNDVIKEDLRTREKEKLIALVTSKGNRSGYDYFLPRAEDLNAINKATDKVNSLWNEWTIQNLIPLDKMPESNDVRSAQYLKYWYKLLGHRQRLLFSILLKNIIVYCNKIAEIYDKEYTLAVATYLSFILGKHIDYNCRSATLNRQRIMAHALTARGISMSWDHAEVNPFVDSCGSLIAMSNNILDGLKYSIEKLNRKTKAACYKNSITQLKGRFDIIVTDPPYLDDVQYAELSEFFYVWERLALREFNDLGNVPKEEDLSVGGHRNNEFFNKLFGISCKKMHEVLTENGILVMFFAHSSIDAWDFVVNSLQKAGFRITATWPVHTESPSNPLARGHASMMSSILIVARKRKSVKSGYIEEIKEEVETHLKGRLDKFWKYGLRGADLTVSAMGATLDVITQYSEIKSYTGDMSIKDVLELVQRFVAEYVLSRYIKNTSGLDPQTSFYLYSRLSDLNGMPFDTANLISKSLNVNLKLFEKEGLIKSIDKGKAKGIQILKYNERDFINTDPKSLIDAVHLVMAAFEKDGFAEADKQMEKVRYSRNEIKDVLVAFLSLSPEDAERQISQKILERMGHSFPKEGQKGIDEY